MSRSTAFEDWKTRANEADMLASAAQLGAKLKKAGREQTGACPICGGTDRFSINPAKRMWNCRGYGGGSGAIGMVMHISGLTFLQACESLTGEPNPNGRRAEPVSDAQRRSAEVRRGLAKEESDRRRAEEARYKDDTRAGAQQSGMHRSPSARRSRRPISIAAACRRQINGRTCSASTLACRTRRNRAAIRR